MGPSKPTHITAALALGVGFHVWIVGGLDLADHPGAAGILVIRDVLAGQLDQGIASHAARLLGAITPPADAAHLLSSLSAGAAMLGAALAAAALGGPRAAVLGALLTATWSLTATQAWLVGPGTLAWGLAWLGVGLAWAGARATRPGVVAAGALCVVLGAATKATAAPALVLLALAPAFGGRGRSAAGLLVGAATSAALAWGLSPDDTPWVAGTGAGSGELLAAWTLDRRDLRLGALPVVTAGAVLGALGRRALPWVVLACSVTLFAAVGHLRGELLHPRHLVVASLGFVVLVACARPRLVAVLAVGLAVLDTLGWATAWQAQRAERIEVAAATLPDVGWFAERHRPLPESVFLSLSIADALKLAELGASAPARGVVLPELPDRRDAHVHVGALEAGRPAGTLSAARCCKESPNPKACAEATADAALAAGLRVVASRTSTLDDQRERAFAMALARALPVSGRARRATWLKRDGRGDGPVPCQGLAYQPAD